MLELVDQAWRQVLIEDQLHSGGIETNLRSRSAAKNAIIPVVTLVGMQLPILVGGSVIIENINLPG